MRLIDADEAVRMSKEPSILDLGDFEEFLADVPTVEVAPVVHGEWEDDPYVWKCNQCHTWVEYSQGTMDMNFCPNCGAKMLNVDCVINYMKDEEE